MTLNQKIFLFEQSKCRYDAVKSRERDWYKCLTPGKISQDYGEYYYFPENGTPDGIKPLLRTAVPNCKPEFISKRSGYLRPGHFVIVPYNGNLGKGWALVENHSSSTVLFTYFLEEK